MDRVEARGKHLLIWLSGDLVLRSHMRMNGSWHIYRPGERWMRPRRDMRIALETREIHAVAFNVPVAEFETAASLARAPARLVFCVTRVTAVARTKELGSGEVAVVVAVAEPLRPRAEASAWALTGLMAEAELVATP